MMDSLFQGTGGNPGILGSIGHKVATIEMKLRGKNEKSDAKLFIFRKLQFTL